MEQIGCELELFSQANNWKSYFRSKIHGHIHGDVLEVGAGIGETTKRLINEKCSSWTCLEPDQDMIKKMKSDQDIIKNEKIKVIQGTVEALNPQEKYDTILYIDVLEHIENDFEEVDRIKKKVKKGGKLVILCPAHNYLYSPFDKAVGHHRRYNKDMMIRVINSPDSQRKVFYLDSLGWFLSLVNKLFLKQSSPKVSQILFWDRVIIPFSKLFDILSFYKFGKTVIGVWTKE